MNQIMKNAQRAAKMQQQLNAVAGEGLYEYRNPNNYDITLPRPTKTGLRLVKKNSTFEGDNYYLQLVKTGMLRLVREIQSPIKETTVEEKLILDQPEMVTEAGAIEHVVQKSPLQKLTETEQTGQPQKPVLINEAPCADSFVIIQ